MSFTFSTSTREILEQVVREPRMRAMTTIPVFAPQTIGLIFAVYILFATSSYLYISGDLHPALMIIINGIAIYGAFTPLHDATHRSVSGNRKLNDLLGTISCLLLLPGITTRIYRYLHLIHHRFAGDKNKDPDEFFVAVPGILVPFTAPFPDIVWSVWYVKHWFTRPLGERVEYSICISFYIGWHVLWLTSPYAMQFFMLWMVPQRLGAFLVIYFFARIQHPSGVTWERAPFQTTVYIPTNLPLKIAMLGQTVHCLHHFLPTVPFYRYHKAWAAGRVLFEAQNIPIRGFLTPAKEIILPQSESQNWLELEVSAVEIVALDTRSYVFSLPKDAEGSLPSFEAGAHIDIQTQNGLVRQYSLCGSPQDKQNFRIAIKREKAGRGGSNALHEELEEGSIVHIGAPRNNFKLVPNAQETVLIGGGIGITPLLSMAHTLHFQGKAFSFHIFARSQETLAFSQRLSRLPFHDHIHLHFDDGKRAKNKDFSSLVGRWRDGLALYVCGPAGFMSAVIGAGRNQGWPNQDIHSETFVAREIDKSENRPFDVELAKSGRILHIKADEYLIDVLNSNDCGVPCSCTQGICGSCLTPVLSGTPEHRDAILSDEERALGNQMCVCVGRAQGNRLVLDI